MKDMTKAVVITGTKVCRKCGRELSINDFYLNKGNKDGHRNVCKHCYTEHNLFKRAGKVYKVKRRNPLSTDEKREKRNEYMRKYRDANRDKVREISRRSIAKRRAAAEEEKAKKKRLPNGQGPRHEYHARQWRERKDELKLRTIERQLGHKIEDGEKPIKAAPQPVIKQPRLCLQCKNWPCFDGIEMLESDFAREGCHGFRKRENNNGN